MLTELFCEVEKAAALRNDEVIKKALDDVRRIVNTGIKNDLEELDRMCNEGGKDFSGEFVDDGS